MTLSIFSDSQPYKLQKSDSTVYSFRTDMDFNRTIYVRGSDSGSETSLMFGNKTSVR